jgi:hypothetical protein
MKRIIFLVMMLAYSLASYSQGFIAPTGDLQPTGPYAMMQFQFIKGETQYVTDTVGRNNVAPYLRVDGQFCYTSSTKQLWQLQGGITNPFWKLYQSGLNRVQVQSKIDSLSALKMNLNGGNIVTGNQTYNGSGLFSAPAFDLSVKSLLTNLTIFNSLTNQITACSNHILSITTAVLSIPSSLTCDINYTSVFGGTSGQTFYVLNNSSHNVTFTNGSVFTMPGGSDFVLTPGNAAQFLYNFSGGTVSLLNNSVIGNQPVVLSGDITGTGSTSIVTTLATVNSNVGAFGTTSSVPTITLDGKGRTTAAVNTPIQITESQVTSLTGDLAARELLTNKTDANDSTATKYFTTGETKRLIAGASPNLTAINGVVKNGTVLSSDTIYNRTAMNSLTLAQAQTKLNTKLNITDTTAMLGNVVHKAGIETITGSKTFTKPVTFANQSGTPATPASGFTTEYFDNLSRYSYINSSGLTRTYRIQYPGNVLVQFPYKPSSILADSSDVRNVTNANYAAINLKQSKALQNYTPPTLTNSGVTSNTDTVGLSILKLDTYKQLNPTYEKSLAYQQFQPAQNGSIYLGDSMSVPYGATYSWAYYVGQYSNTTYTNLAISSMGNRKEYQQLACLSNGMPKVSVAPLFTMVGFNNIRTSTIDTVRIRAIQAGHRAIAALQFAKYFYYPSQGATGTTFPFTYSRAYSGAGAGSVSTLLDWGSRTYWVRNNDPANAGANYYNRSSIQAGGETATITIPPADGIAIGTWGCTTAYNMSRIKITVDGVDKVTYDPNNRYYTGYSSAIEGFTNDNIINDAIVITGLGTLQPHTVVITFLDAGRIGAFDYLAVLKTPQETMQTPLYVNDIPHLGNDANVGYNYPGYITTQAVLDNANALRKSNLIATFPNFCNVFYRHKHNIHS